MSRLTLGVALASLALATACGGDAEEAAAPASSAASSAAGAASSAAAPTPSAAGGAAGGAATVLNATVGSPEDPNAFVIDLTDEAGKKVTELPAGNYTINVNDPTKIHNWHLRGGSVDETTTVPEVTKTTFEVTLEPGEYTYICDPHPRMVGQFTVT